MCSSSSSASPGWKLLTGTKRIVAEFKTLRGNLASHGFLQELSLAVEDNPMVWRLKLHNFDADVPGGRQLNQDLSRLKERHGQDHILIELEFPADYPSRPFFARVVSPRCVMYTGHVTAGGSICLEALTTSGSPGSWQPDFSVEALLNVIMINMIGCPAVYIETLTGSGGLTGPLRVDFSCGNPCTNTGYSTGAARAAFDRTVQNHKTLGWSDPVITRVAASTSHSAASTLYTLNRTAASAEAITDTSTSRTAPAEQPQTPDGHTHFPDHQALQTGYPKHWDPMDSSDPTGFKLVELPLPPDMDEQQRRVELLVLAAAETLAPRKVEHVHCAFPRLPLPDVYAALLLADQDVDIALDYCRSFYWKVNQSSQELDAHDRPVQLWLASIDAVDDGGTYHEGTAVAAEVDKVLKLVQDSGGERLRAMVVKLERVQNLALWERFSLKKQQMLGSRNEADLNERLLFHGTCSSTASVIAKEGFDVKRATAGCSYGRGIYLTDSSATAFGYCRDKKRSRDDEYKLLLSSVLLGRQCQGSPSMQTPPAGFDSVHSESPNTVAGFWGGATGQQQHPYCHVIFDNDQAYPEYVITFKSLEEHTGYSSGAAWAAFDRKVQNHQTLGWSEPVITRVAASTSQSAASTLYTANRTAASAEAITDPSTSHTAPVEQPQTPDTHAHFPGHQAQQTGYPKHWDPMDISDPTGFKLVELPLPPDMARRGDLWCRRRQRHWHHGSAFPRLPLLDVYAALLLADQDVDIALDYCRSFYWKINQSSHERDAHDRPLKLWMASIDDAVDDGSTYHEDAAVAAEVDKVLKLVQDSGGERLRAMVVKLERVQNLALWERFSLKKQQMLGSRDEADLNERLLFHGTCSSTAGVIAKEGFDAKRATASCSYGRGIYLTDSSATAFGYCRDKKRSRDDDNKSDDEYKLLLSSVPLGRQCQGSPSMQTPPAGFDSVHSESPNTVAGFWGGATGQQQHPYCHVIFDNDQAYPEYVITFKSLEEVPS